MTAKIADEQDLQPTHKKMVMVGNPNVGKSVLFHRLTGQYVDVSNYAGTTMEFYCSKWGCDFLVDTPGIYGLSGLNPEEIHVRNEILTADVVINVVDAVHLDRDLFLTCQLADAGVPLLVALNMMDELRDRGLEINVEELERRLGVPVVPMVAITGEGLDKLTKRILDAQPGRSDPLIMELSWKYAGLSRLETLLILEGDQEMAARVGLAPGTDRDVIYAARHHRVNEIVAAVLRVKGRDDGFATRLGRWLINPVTGIPALLVTLWLMYELVGVFFAQIVVEFTEGVIMEGYYEPLVRAGLSRFLELDSALGITLVGQFGVLTMTVTYLIGLLFPLVGGFFLVLSILEDSGYLPRIAILMDRLMSYVGLNGQAIIPIVLGFGCVTMATITTRMLSTERERRIAMFILALAVPCSAQLAFVTAILGTLGPSYVALYAFFILTIMIGAGTVLDRLLPGYAVPLWLQLPAMRLPRPGNVLIKTWTRTIGFLKEAFPIFVGGALFLSILQVTGAMTAIQNAMRPLIAGWLLLPSETASAFLMGFIRRDFGTAGVMSVPMDPLQTFVALITLTMFVPCIATVMVIFKERGWREGALMWGSITTIAFALGGLFSQLIFFIHGRNEVLALPLTALVIFITLVVIIVALPRRRRGVADGPGPHSIVK